VGDGSDRSVSTEKPAPERVPGIRRGDGALTTGGPSTQCLGQTGYTPEALYKVAYVSVSICGALARPTYLIAEKFVATFIISPQFGRLCCVMCHHLRRELT